MHLELTEVLTCPTCGPPHGLIAFVDRMEDRRIVQGHLDCPVCERRHQIRGGAVFFGRPSGDDGGERIAAEKKTADKEAAGSAGSAAAGDDAGLAAALLGPAAGPETLLVAGGSAGLAAGLAALRPEATILSFGTRVGRSHDRVHHFVTSYDGGAEILPVRPGRLDGAVIAWPDRPNEAEREILDAAVRTLRSGARLVRLAPRGGEPGFEQDGLQTLAGDERAWVGART